MISGPESFATSRDKLDTLQIISNTELLLENNNGRTRMVQNVL